MECVIYSLWLEAWHSSTSKRDPNLAKCASRHSRVQFLSAHLPRWLRTGRFSEPSGGLRSHKTVEQHDKSRQAYLFAHLHLLSSDSFSSMIFFLLFSFLTLTTSAISFVHIVGSLTPKLPSITHSKTSCNVSTCKKTAKPRRSSN